MFTPTSTKADFNHTCMRTVMMLLSPIIKPSPADAEFIQANIINLLPINLSDVEVRRLTLDQVTEGGIRKAVRRLRDILARSDPSARAPPTQDDEAGAFYNSLHRKQRAWKLPYIGDYEDIMHADCPVFARGEVTAY